MIRIPQDARESYGIRSQRPGSEIFEEVGRGLSLEAARQAAAFLVSRNENVLITRTLEWQPPDALETTFTRQYELRKSRTRSGRSNPLHHVLAGSSRNSARDGR
jgi:hypothetical protein